MLLEQESVQPKDEEALEELEDGQAVDSASEASEPEEQQKVSASQSQILVQELTNMVHSGLRLPPGEASEVTYSSLGSLKPQQSAQAFPLHPLLEKVMYADWDHPDRVFVPPKRFFLLYPMEEKFVKNWGMPLVDTAVSSLNKYLTGGQCPGI